MKKTRSIIAAFTLLAFAALSQNKTEGVISYNMVVNVHASLSKAELIYKALIPKTVTIGENVYFKGTSYRTEILEQKKDKSTSVSISSPGQDQLVSSDDKISYPLYKRGEKVYYTEEKFTTSSLVKDKTSTKTILGYKCYKAIYKDEKKETYELWITDELRTSANPFQPGLAEGAVLEINSVKINFIATKVEFKTLDPKLFELSAFKKITKEQAEDLSDELEAEARAQKK